MPVNREVIDLSLSLSLSLSLCVCVCVWWGGGGGGGGRVVLISQSVNQELLLETPKTSLLRKPSKLHS